MDKEINDFWPKRLRSSARASSFRSLNLSSDVGAAQVDDDDENRSVSEAGDIGDRALHSLRYSGSGRPRFSLDDLRENVVVPIPEDGVKQSQLETVSPLSSAAIVENEEELPWLLKYLSALIHLAVFGILGVLTRYLLEKLFGPGVVGATSDQSYMYLDLPSNMVGSFLMGWFGVAFKSSIVELSDELAIGLTTGYLGSLTTFSGWNQKMLQLCVEGQWVFSFLGFFLGLFLVAYSIIFGVETAKGLKCILKRIKAGSKSNIFTCKWRLMLGSVGNQLTALGALLVLLGLLLGLSVALLKRGFKNDRGDAHLWLGCIVGPIGVWVRFYLARFNGRGLGRNGFLKWVPFGTLIANVSAACIMAALATLKKELSKKDLDTVATGLQFGLCGCLSTVSTFIAEFEAMRQSKHPWRAYAYASATIVVSFTLGILIYSVPVWTKGQG